MGIQVGGGGGGGAYTFPPMPLPIKDDGFLHSQANIIPHKGTLIDAVKLPSDFSVATAGQVQGYLGEVVVWSVLASQFNIACDGFLGAQALWYDSSVDRLYMWGLDTGVSPIRYYTAYITLETGAVTVLGDFTLATDDGDETDVGAYAAVRTSTELGDFTLRNRFSRVLVDSSTGIMYHHLKPASYKFTSEGAKMGSFSTNLSTTSVTGFFQDPADAGKAYVEVTRGANGNTNAGYTVRVPIPTPLLSTSLLGEVAVVPWGDMVKVFGQGNVTTGNAVVRTFDRADFEQWLEDIADFAGLA